MFRQYKDVSASERTQVWNNGFSDYMFPIHMTKEQLDNRLSSLSISQKLSKILYIDQQPAGIYLHGEGVFSGEKIAWLGGMAVDSKFRNQHLSVQMLHEFELTAKSRNTDTLYLEAIDGNNRAIFIYQKFGFVPLCKVLILESQKKYPLKTHHEIQKVETLEAIGITEDKATLWQNKTIHGYDCLGIYAAKDLVGYAVVSFKEDCLVFHQIKLDKAYTQIKSVLGSFQINYAPKRWIGSNLVADEATTQSLLANGFSEVLSQHQYRKKI